MNIYFQFLTQIQTAEAVEMLRLIPVLTGSPEVKGRLKVYAQATITRSTFSDLESLSARLAKKSFNQSEIELQPLRTRVRGIGRITSLSAVFSPSPTSVLWCPTKDWRINAERVSRNRYMTAKTKEDVLHFHHVSKEPSVFEVRLEIATKATPEAVLDRFADKLALNTPDGPGKLHLFGCCDVVEPVFIPQLKATVLMHERFQVMMNIKPLAYPELGVRFEALHPLMFGSKRLCKGLSIALGKQAKLIKPSNDQDFAIVRLAPTVDTQSARERAPDWLITGSDKLT